MRYPDGKRIKRYSAIDNEVLEKVADIELTRPERKVLDRIIKDTIGYPEIQKWTQEEVRRVTYEIPMERFVGKTGLSEEEIETALASLEERRIIKRDGDEITFNHHLEDWSYQRRVVVDYVDNKVNWGDKEFDRNTIENIDESQKQKNNSTST